MLPQHISVLQNGTAACCLRDETRHEPHRRNTVQKRPEPRNRPSSLPPQYIHCTKKIYGDKTQMLCEVLDICINSRSATPNFGFSRAFNFIYHCLLYRQDHVGLMVVQVSMEPDFLRVLRFCSVSIITQMPHTYAFIHPSTDPPWTTNV